MKIGILAVQGSVMEHRWALEKLGATVVEVRLPEDLEAIQGIILPGGESTTQSKLMKRFGLFEALQEKIKNGLPAWGTCAGAILLAKQVEGKNKPDTLALMDISAHRNAYGSQLNSFENELEAHLNERQTIEGVFIRAPKLKSLSDQVQVLSKYKDDAIMLQQGKIMACSFHPELTDDLSVHRYFLSYC